LFRSAPAAAGQGQAGQQEGSRHDLDEVPPRERIGPFAGALWELPLNPLLEFGRFRQLVQAPPIFAAGLGFRTRWRNGFHWLRSAELQLCAMVAAFWIAQSWSSALLLYKALIFIGD